MIRGHGEEVLCRGYFMVSMGRRYPMWAAVLGRSGGIGGVCGGGQPFACLQKIGSGRPADSVKGNQDIDGI